MNDLKACVKNINLQASYPGRRDDFETESGYQQWRTTELSTISQIMMGMCKNNPELLKSTPTESAASGRRAGEGSRPFSVALTAEGGAIGENGFTPADPEALSQAVDAEEEETFGSFVYIPPDPKAYYRRALELCIDYDLEQIKYQPEEEEVSLSILSRKHIDLLNECALRWRLMGPFRVLVNLDVIKYKYDRGEVPLDCISEALSTTQKAVDDGEFEAWVVDDVSSR